MDKNRKRMPPQLGGILFDLRKFGCSIQAGERNARQFLCSNLFLKTCLTGIRKAVFLSLLIEGPFLYLRHRHTKDLIGPIALRSFVETLPRDDARRLRRLRRCFWGRQFYRRTVAEGKKAVETGFLEHEKIKFETIV